MRRGAIALPVVLVALVAAAGCGDDVGGAFGTMRDCAQVARPQRVADRAGDATAGGTGATDLVAVAVARGRTETCVAFETAGDVAPPTAYSVRLEPADGGATAQLEVVLLGGQAPEVRLRSADAAGGRIVAGAVVGGDGDRLTVVVPAGGLREAGVPGAFRWRARAITAGDDGREATDDAP